MSASGGRAVLYKQEVVLKKMNIALVGLGVVGTGVMKTYQMNKQKIDAQLGGELVFKYAVDRNLSTDRGVDLSNTTLTDNFVEVVNDPEVDVVIELIGGYNPAVDFIKKALSNGKHVVTANKAVIAKYGKELRTLAKDNGVTLRYEASVGGGIPIINTLSEKLISNQFEELVGIMNGTTNYILTRMTEENLGFDEALKLAQDAGFAEADPTADIEGYDACNKLCILAHKAFGLDVVPDDVPTVGITSVSKEDIAYASELGYRIKLLVAAHKTDNSVSLRVNPALIKKDHPLASVNYEMNALFLKGNALGDIMLYGPGAGSLPTGSAVLGDCIDIFKGVEYLDVPAIDAKLGNGSELQYYIRLEVFDQPGVLAHVAALFGQQNISLESVVQRAKGDEVAPLVFITHETTKDQIDAAIAEINAYDKVAKVASIMSVEM